MLTHCPTVMRVNIKNTEHYQKYQVKLNSILNNGYTPLKFLKFNSIEYRPGLMVIIDRNPYGIIYIFQKNNTFKFICEKYKMGALDKNLCSVEIIKLSESEISEFDDIWNEKSYQKTHSNDKIYIIAESLMLITSQ